MSTEQKCVRNSNEKRNDTPQPVYAPFVGHQGRGDYKIARKQRCEDLQLCPDPPHLAGTPWVPGCHTFAQRTKTYGGGARPIIKHNNKKTGILERTPVICIKGLAYAILRLRVFVLPRPLQTLYARGTDQESGC